MMMFRPLLAAVLLLSNAAYASEIQVRSGDHSSFSRLVLDVPAGTEWLAKQDSTGATIAVNGHTEGFDISNVFERIDRRFIQSVETSSSSISVLFGCRCTADIFLSGDTMIVIDVYEASESNTSTARPLLTDALRFVGQRPLRFESRSTEISGEQTDAIELTSPSASANVAPTAATNQLVAVPSLVDPSPDIELTTLEQAQQKLSERIGFAATTGVLRPSQTRSLPPISEPRPQIDTSIFDSSSPDSQTEPSLEPLGGNLRITSSSDIPISAAEVLAGSTMQGVRCVDASEVRVQDWGPVEDFASSIARLRRGLFSEFDVVKEETAVKLAQTYLYFGFGAEALQVLSLSPSLAETNRALTDIAHVMEFGAAQTDNYLSHFADCDSDAALWAVLAMKTLDPSATINSDAAVRTLSGLPLHLRQFLAPLLSRKLLSYGDEDAAASALRGLERTSGSLPAAAELAKADIELAAGDVLKAQERLHRVVASNEQQSAEALIRYVDTHLDADIEIQQDIATLVEAYAVELRDDPLGEELRRTHVLALAKSGQFDAAFDALGRIRPSNGAPEADAVRSSLLELLARGADDVAFLNHAFVAMADKPNQMSARAARALGARLADLGFFTEAESILATRQDIPFTAENRILRAEISLGLSRPQEALAFLGSAEGAAAKRLRAEATSSMGDHDTAQAIYADLGDETRRVQSAWLSENWLSLLGTAEPAAGAIVDVAAARMNTSAASDGMLERTTDTLEESETARRAIERLLEAPLGVQPAEN